jgi:NAD(P)-dependent dehydrogenase (short-subunit alcohol dehydrogenase family)
LESLARELGENSLPLQCDATDGEQVRTAVRVRLDRTGRIDVLVNNAGVMRVGPFLDPPESNDRLQIETNLLGPIRLLGAVLPIIVQQGCGIIINIASVLGRVTRPGAAVDVATKWGIGALTGSHAWLGKKNGRVVHQAARQELDESAIGDAVGIEEVRHLDSAQDQLQMPASWFYLQAGVADALPHAAHPDFDTAFRSLSNTFGLFEFGLSPFSHPHAGAYRFLFWYDPTSDESGDNHGFAGSFDQPATISRPHPYAGPYPVLD